jgi:hypothetical protein
MSSSLPRGAPVPTKIASKPSAEQRLHAGDVRVVADLDAHVENLVDLVHEDAFGQAEGGDVGAHQAARPVVLFEHDDFVAERHQVVRDGERGRARADTGDALSVFWLGILGRRSVMSSRRSAATRFRRQMATGLPSTRPRRQAGSQGRSQVRPRIAGKHIRLPVEHVGVGIAALRDQPDVFGNVGVGRTGPLAVHNFVEVILAGLKQGGFVESRRGAEGGYLLARTPEPSQWDK